MDRLPAAPGARPGAGSWSGTRAGDPGRALLQLDWRSRPAAAAPPAGRTWNVLGGGAPLVAALRALGDTVAVHPDAASAVGHPTVLAPFLPPPGGAGAAGASGAAPGALVLLKSWLAGRGRTGARLVVVTRGAVAADTDEDVPDLAHAPLWGLVRAALAEHPDAFALLDVDGTEASWKALPAAVASGEPQQALREGVVRVPRLVAAPLGGAPGGSGFGPGSTVLVTGAAGALGGLVARHLVRAHGVRRLVLAGRSAADARLTTLAADLRRLGARAVVAGCDMTDRAALADLLAPAPGAPAITAVVHCAGTVDDGVLTRLTPHRMAGALAAKAESARHLHELTQDLDLTAFVLFSSAAGVLGAPGRANHAAAGAFLDALAHHRRARGLPALSLAWGPWAQRGGTAGPLELHRSARSGVLGLTPRRGLALLDAALGAGRPVLVPVRLDTARLRAPAADPARVPGVLRALLRPLPPAAWAAASETPV
ncbi:beta-ketoacyl reductase [Streptomyces sp. NRRL F-5123]|uniref:beta-ketoacyl reductase n=1 Tax=Streptomyces sp. NRRL F-5123 TaxID=1463856 RepID=UPI0006943372|nr:beta-ketoacyl reductase [Streptomyces sp. NRRL F-5123]